MVGFAPPTINSLRLGRALKELRERLGWSAARASKEIGYSPTWITRVERGEIRPRPGDVLSMLVVYGVAKDSDEGRGLVVLAQAAKRAGWWVRHGDVLALRYLQFIAFESEADSERVYESMVVPGLLQTPEYARAVVSVGRETDVEVIEQHVVARMTRRKILDRRPPFKLHAVVSEAALAPVGEPDMFRDQLAHLADIATKPNVTIQVLLFEAGASLVGKDGFTMLDFEGGGPKFGYIETVAGQLLLESPGDIAHLDLMWGRLTTLARSPVESLRLIKERVG
jgi:transcriptional regulator with XRE-family HTH domain